MLTTAKERTFAIGDIHGCLAKLRDLLDRLPYQPGRDRLVFLGDYINRGPDTAKVLDLLCELRERDPAGIITLLGNHEYLLLEYHRSGDPALLPYLRKMGIDTTLKSYGVHTGFGLQSLNFLPPAHLAFLQGLRLYWESADYLFVHAGFEPDLPLAEQDATTCCESRDSFITSNYNFGKKVVFGHSEFELPLLTASKIGIDTGAGHGNLLTAVELPGEIFYHS